MTGFAYLASPYSHPDPRTRDARAKLCVHYLAALARMDVVAYSPIWHWHCAAVKYDMPTDAEWWWTNNLQFMKAANCMIVAEMPGWRDSNGIRLEMDWAKRNGVTILYCNDTNDFALTAWPLT